MRKFAATLFLLLLGCTGIPENVRPVDGFEVERYMGRWYEIARLDHSFERGLSRVTADYRLREDGGVSVLNRGYSAKDQAWKEIEGKGYFVDRSDRGHLKVSFFGPFYGSYIVFALDREHYRHALVCGPDRSYLWILAREPALQGDVLNSLTAEAEALGFDTRGLIWVEH